MDNRRSDYDVTDKVKTTDSSAVSREVHRIFQHLYPDASSLMLVQAFCDVGRIFRGDYVGYLACDTDYHDIQHTLDVALAMARLMDGYERSRKNSDAIGPRLFTFGIITALLHDIGYIRRAHDTRHRNGAEYTLTHVSRSEKFIEAYMRTIGMAELAPVARQIVHFTGYERPIELIEVPSTVFRLLGNMLGTADIIAQMSDRCYLEKCRDRLYPELVAGGLAGSRVPQLPDKMIYSSPRDLVSNTPNFYHQTAARLNDQLGAAYNYADAHFGGQNLYLDVIEKNVSYARSVEHAEDMYLLRRMLPESTNGKNE